MQFKMERHAPYALAVQLAVVLAGIAALAAHLTRPAPPPHPCATPAQILYENHTACLPGVDAMLRALASPAGQDFVRAAYVRDSASGAWVRAYLAGTRLRVHPYGKDVPPAPAEPTGPVPRHCDVVEPTGRLVTKD